MYATETVSARGSSNEPSRPWVYGCSGPGRELGARPALDDLARVHDHDAVGDLQHGAEVVADEQDGEALLPLDAAQQAHDRPLHQHVEPRRRLVQQHEARPQQQRERQDHALPHAAGQLVRVGAHHAVGVQLDVGQHLADPGVPVAVGRGAPAVRVHRVVELRGDAQHRVQRVHGRLEHRGDLAPAQPVHAALVQLVQVGAVEPHGTAGVVGRRVQQPQHGVAERGLAAARLAEEPDELALLDAERDVPHGVRRRQVPRPVVDGQVLYLDQRHHCSLRCGLLSASTPKLTNVRPVVSRASRRPGTSSRTRPPVRSAPSWLAQ